MQVARWGDSLAVRIPADVVRELGLKEGDVVDLQKLDDGRIGISRRPAALVQKEVNPEARATALMCMRELAAPLPPGYRFDRDDANMR